MLWSEFKAKVVVGVFGSVALIDFEEKEVTKDGEVVADGKDDIVKTDIDTVTPSVWFDYAKDKEEVAEGTYIMTGRMSVDHELVEFHDVKFENVQAD